MRRAAHDREAGFALVESIAVLALSALVLLTMLIATDLVSRNSALAARRANAIETLTTGLAAVRRDLEATSFVPTGPKPEDQLLFSGREQAVAIARPDDRSGIVPGEGVVLIEAQYEEGRGVLVRSSARLLPGARGFGNAGFGNRVVMVSGPWKYRFSYADLAAGAARWKGTWTEGTRLPAAIRLEVFDQNDREVVPPLTVRVRVDGSGCAGAGFAACAEKGLDGEQPDNEPPPEGQE